MREETLRALKRAGLTSIAFGIETPDEITLRKHRRLPVADDRQRAFIVRCRAMGIRTVAGFMIGFPHDTAVSIRAVLRHAKELNPTFANFNIVTSYPSTAFRDHVGDRVRSRDVTRYDVYTPIMYYEHLTPDEVLKLHARCFASFYFRWPYLFANAHLLWPWLAKMRIGRADEGAPLGERCLLHASRHKRRTVSS